MTGSGMIRVEAMRLARNAVKLSIRDSGDKLSNWAMKDINSLAERRWFEFLDQATANMARWSSHKSQVPHKNEGPEISGFACAEYRCRMIIGYCRVSTDGQSFEGQQSALKSAGADRIFAEKVSGAKTDRKALAKALASLASGDVLLVTRLDRLARSTRDLLNVLANVAEKGAGFRSLADSWCDTHSAHGRLMLTILGGLAEFERELIKARTGEGRASAQARGVKFGRKPKLTAHQVTEALARRANGEPLTEIAKTFNCSHSTISRLQASP
jgi:DNA invertase Pin-like site-specific DNA recombinase